MSQVATDRFGDYELIRYLATGGMADLYLARSPRFDKDVVLKRIQPRYADMTRVVNMFIDEGRIAQALDHPNIVKILDVGQVQGAYFIAMEYIPGPDLLTVCRRGMELGSFLPRTLSLAITGQILKGLAYAHESKDAEGKPFKVVHCDISPGNIVVSWGGTAKIVDFGIARAAIQLRAEDHSVAGKYNYMAPEQVRGEHVDSRADLFALGIILYEITVGRRLFRGSPEDVMKMVLEQTIVPPEEIRSDYPKCLSNLVMRALKRDPAKRFPSATAFRKEVLACLKELNEPHDKREIARYLQGIFASPKPERTDSDSSQVRQNYESAAEFEPDPMDDSSPGPLFAAAEADDLELERTPLAMLPESQRLQLLEVDAEDAEAVPGPSLATRPGAKTSALAHPAPVLRAATPVSPDGRDPDHRPTEHKSAVRPANDQNFGEILLGVGVLLLVVGLYFLIFH